ncbi:uncharacterized protein Dvar_51300 [Desulfosarcina variabilis str. Montpellier]|uniref:hypothetical protein n=1 Tax=Desulfosarcina variabilis TaxID=2300 RepID=UPI003AFA22D9
MHRNNPFYQDLDHQLAEQTILIRQVKADYTEVNERWEQVQKGRADISEIEKILQKIAWVKSGIEAIKMLQQDKIEGIIQADIKNIEDRIVKIQERIRNKI